MCGQFFDKAARWIADPSRWHRMMSPYADASRAWMAAEGLAFGCIGCIGCKKNCEGEKVLASLQGGYTTPA
jgi:ferredoxin